MKISAFLALLLLAKVKGNESSLRTRRISKACGSLAGAFLRNLQDDTEITLGAAQIGPQSYHPSADNNRWSIRCDVDGSIDYVKFHYNGNTQTEFSAPYYMNGDFDGWINDVPYLESCGKVKEILLEGFLWSEGDEKPCFQENLYLDALCDESTESLPPMPSTPPTTVELSNSPSLAPSIHSFIPSPAHSFYGTESLQPSSYGSNAGSAAASSSLQPSSCGSATASASLQPSYFVTPPPDYDDKVSIGSVWDILGDVWVWGRRGSEVFPNYGLVQVHSYPTGQWEQTIRPVNGTATMQFGSSVALAKLSGDDSVTMAVGAPRYTLFGESFVPFAGSVYLYTKVDGTWQQQSEILADPPESDNYFGSNVVLEGETMVVAGIEFDNSKSQGLFVFGRNQNGIWEQRQRIMPISTSWRGSSEFGRSLVLRGNSLFVGDPYSRAVYIYSRTNDDGQWYLSQTIDGNKKPYGSFGYSISVSGDFMLVGVPRANKAFFYRQSSDGVWVEQQEFQATSTTSYLTFGVSVALNPDATRAVVGSNQHDCEEFFCGRAYVYRRQVSSDGSDEWVEERQIKQQRNFGLKVAWSDSRTLLVSSYTETFVYNNWE